LILMRMRARCTPHCTQHWIEQRADRIRAINHRGDFYHVAGPLNLPRCPQGRPVLVQAGSSDTGRRFAARHADAVFTAHMAKATAQKFYADLKRLATTEGRLRNTS
jgi:alkanesulfonate monooxygenase SsuD/methylene tetrahydromethanopterin reductase-like flavin-dependent oxidoreductase (luciferase family)